MLREQSPEVMLIWARCTGVQITCSTSGAYHTQHAARHMIRRDSSAVDFDRVLIHVLSFYFNGLDHYPVREGRKPEYPEKKKKKKKPDDKMQKMPYTKARRFKHRPRLEPALQGSVSWRPATVK